MTGDTLDFVSRTTFPDEFAKAQQAQSRAQEARVRVLEAEHAMAAAR